MRHKWTMTDGRRAGWINQTILDPIDVLKVTLPERCGTHRKYRRLRKQGTRESHHVSE